MLEKILAADDIVDIRVDKEILKFFNHKSVVIDSVVSVHESLYERVAMYRKSTVIGTTCNCKLKIFGITIFFKLKVTVTGDPRGSQRVNRIVINSVRLSARELSGHRRCFRRCFDDVFIFILGFTPLYSIPCNIYVYYIQDVSGISGYTVQYILKSEPDT